jgi:hypothetical protein
MLTQRSWPASIVSPAGIAGNNREQPRHPGAAGCGSPEEHVVGMVGWSLLQPFVELGVMSLILLAVSSSALSGLVLGSTFTAVLRVVAVQARALQQSVHSTYCCTVLGQNKPLVQ